MNEWTAEAARAAIEQAEAKLDALCQGTERFTMRIPADPKYDHDLVISRGLQAGKNALNALTAANQRAAGLEAGVERLKGLLEQVTPFVEGWAQRNRPIYDRDKDGDAMGYFSIGDVRRARRLGDELKAALQDAER